MIFLKSGYIPNLKESHLCEYYFSPSCLQVFTSYNMSELQNRLRFINASKCRNFNAPAINITFCCCCEMHNKLHVGCYCSCPPPHCGQQTCSAARSASANLQARGLKFCAFLLAEVTLNALHYLSSSWKTDSEVETAYNKM